MGLLDLFRPKWMHSDPAVRRVAIANLSDAPTLARIAREDPDRDIRLVALARIDDPEYLTRLALTGPLTPVHAAAVERITDQPILARIAGAAMDLDVRDLAIRKLTDQHLLASIVRDGGHATGRLAAAETLTDQDALAEIVAKNGDAAIRAAAAAKMTDSDALEALAFGDRDPAVRLAAARATGDDEVLIRVATEDEDFEAREAAVALLGSQEALLQVALHPLEVGTDLLGDQFALRAGQDAAVARLTDEAYLAEVATKSADQRIARAAIDRIDDPILLGTVLHSKHWFAREAAIARITDPRVILALITEDQDLDVLQAAVARLAEADFEPLLGDPELRATVLEAHAILLKAAEAETGETGSERLITGSLPSAAKIAAQFERVVLAWGK